MSAREQKGRPPQAGWDWLWRELRRSRRPFLGLDFDGTLAPFAVERTAARPAPGAIAALERLRDQGTAVLAVISGRPMNELAELLPVRGIPLAACHGRELVWPDGRREVLAPAAAQHALLEAGYEAARGRADENRLERKLGSVALHTRDLAPGAAAALEAEVGARWRRLGGAGELDCRPFDGGVELRAAGVDKGTALRHLLDEVCPGPPVLYLGDDDTDEDAFRAVARVPGGYGIRVGAAPSTTAAAARLSGPEAVIGFLEEVFRALHDR